MYRIVIVSLLLLTIACGQADKVPDGILSKEEMRDVLIDMNMADAYAGDNGEGHILVSDSLRQTRVRVYYAQILQLRKLSREEFQKSYTWYEAHPDRLKEVYEMMKATVTAEKDAAENGSRIKAYIENPKALLPFGNNVLISNVSDTIIPFVKKNKRVILKR